VNDVETEAIMALCHHQDDYFHHECEACRFRSAAAIEHLTVTIGAFIDSLTNAYRSQA
jgi:hypothetical protein